MSCRLTRTAAPGDTVTVNVSVSGTGQATLEVWDRNSAVQTHGPFTLPASFPVSITVADTLYAFYAVPQGATDADAVCEVTIVNPPLRIVSVSVT